MVTSAPAAANRRVVASPRPDAPPVTTAPAPLICMGGEGSPGATVRAPKRPHGPLQWSQQTVLLVPVLLGLLGPAAPRQEQHGHADHTERPGDAELTVDGSARGREGRSGRRLGEHL